RRVPLRIWTHVIPCTGLFLVSCLTHTSNVLIHVPEPNAACQMARDIAARVASEFRLREANRTGIDPVLPDDSMVLSRFLAYRSADSQLPGSGHTVYLTVFSEKDCREIAFAFTDYDDGQETAFVAQMRSRLVELIRENQPNAVISVRETTTRTLPP
ncbi:MAG TPA: hypothetical protein VFY49_03165, partial [Myxococcota bacterium]|nr:hypothetical protein [Myxococcota bacterium]